MDLIKLTNTALGGKATNVLSNSPAIGQIKRRVDFHGYHSGVMKLMMRTFEDNADNADTDYSDDDGFHPETPFNHQQRYWTVKRY